MKFKRRAMKADVPSVAMGDIAFNLLIFFVILARAQDDAHLEWRPAAGTRLEEVREAKVSVVIDKDNKLYLNGQPSARPNWRRGWSSDWRTPRSESEWSC
jgi:biopolymer transport protein ExbD